jgi:hypothetical protein
MIAYLPEEGNGASEVSAGRDALVFLQLDGFAGLSIA